MNTKLTLSLDSIIISRAKKRFRTEKKSLSKVTEDYLRLLTTAKPDTTTNSPIVSELTGIAELNKNVNDKALITEYLLEKYS